MNTGGELRLIVSKEADTDTDDITYYLSLQNEELGNHFSAAVVDTFEFLLQNSGVGRQYAPASVKNLGIRQWPVRGFTNYLIFYVPLDNGIRIQRVLHGMRNLHTVLEE